MVPGALSALGPGNRRADGELISRALDARRHPEQAYRTCLGLLGLAKRYSPERLEAACQRANTAGICSYKGVHNILKNKLDQLPLEPGTDQPLAAARQHSRRTLLPLRSLPMLTQPLLEKLSQLRLAAFRQALEEQLQNPQYAELSFEERLGLLVDIELTRRANNRLRRRIKSAQFPLQATIADLDLSAGRGLKRAQILELAQGEWVRRHLNLLVLGATGAGKTYLACALGRAACEAEFNVRYVRTSRLLQSLELAQADGSYPQLLRSLARIQLAHLRRLAA